MLKIYELISHQFRKKRFIKHKKSFAFRYNTHFSKLFFTYFFIKKPSLSEKHYIV